MMLIGALLGLLIGAPALVLLVVGLTHRVDNHDHPAAAATPTRAPRVPRVRWLEAAE
jgi:hypothetical protein